MEHKPDRFKLNYLCEFDNADVEADFLEREKARGLGIARFLTLLGGGIFAAFALSDYSFFGAERGFYISAALRGAALLAAVVAFFLAGKFKRRDHAFLAVTAAELIVFFMYLAILCLRENIEAAPAFAARFMYVPQFMYAALFIPAVFLIPNKWKHSLIAGCVMLTGYIVFAAVFFIPSTEPAAPAIAFPASLAARGIYLAVCIASCAVILRGKENALRKQFAAELRPENASITDRLTGIYNRGRFEYVLSLWIKNMRHDPFCLILFRLDNFRGPRASFGRGAGDEALIEMTEIIAAHIRDNDVFARMGDEEFAVLFGRVDGDKAKEIAERLRNAVGSVSSGKAGSITISTGVVRYRRPENQREESAEEFIGRAEEKMREEKEAGTNRTAASV